MRRDLLGVAAVVLVGLSACGGDAAPAPDATVPVTPAAWSADEVRQLQRMRLVSAFPPDPTNRWADDADAAALGRRLFYDPGLSASGRFSCASCHDPARHFTDGLPRAVAAGEAARNTPALEGSQAGPWYFWDGRADSLWSQAAGPIEAAVEMDSDRMHVARYVLRAYAAPYAALFGAPPDLSDPARFPARARPDDGAAGQAWAAMAADDRDAVDAVFVHVLKALAAFERTMVPGEAPFDRYVDAVTGGDPHGGGALDDDAVAGLSLFLRRGNCVACHHGPWLSDGAFHALGVPDAQGYDPGRTVGAAQVLKAPFNCQGAFSDTTTCEELRYLNPTFDDFRSAFKTPTLRNVTQTAPYMHQGQLATLRDVLDFYAVLPGAPMIGHRELTLVPLGLTEAETRQLIAFLGSLEAPVRPEVLPPVTSP
ncbi:MAG: cytochrome-c peroxidase [Alphaproteobacteria bacterium]|nr:cytochrome-c peroxidase [Alphaproteobacteria bacterium]